MVFSLPLTNVSLVSFPQRRPLTATAAGAAPRYGQLVSELIQSVMSLAPSGSVKLTATGGIRLESVASSRLDKMLMPGEPGATSLVALPTIPCVLSALHVTVSFSASE